jgi:hypothetical protein
MSRDRYERRHRFTSPVRREANLAPIIEAIEVMNLFSADDSTFSDAQRAVANDAASAVLIRRPVHVEMAEWRKAVADAVTNEWQDGITPDELRDAIAARLGLGD